MTHSYLLKNTFNKFYQLVNGLSGHFSDRHVISTSEVLHAIQIALLFKGSEFLLTITS